MIVSQVRDCGEGGKSQATEILLLAMLSEIAKSINLHSPFFHLLIEPSSLREIAIMAGCARQESQHPRPGNALLNWSKMINKAIICEKGAFGET